MPPVLLTKAVLTATMKPKHIIFRSKGCRTCRQRKVKCDESRPVCQRCIRSRFECEGYSEPTKFLCDNPQATDITSTSVAKHIRASQVQSLSSVPQALQYPAEPTCISFLVCRLSIGTPGDRKGFSWLRPGLESRDESSLFYAASRCLAEVYYGRLFRQEDIVTAGMSKYGDMLRHLREQLQVPELFHDNSLMSVIMTAVVIESITNQSAAGLFAHIYGLGQVVKQAGPKAFCRRPNILIFEMCRCFFIGRAIIGKHKTFVSEPEWKTVPWTYEGKSTLVKLWDIICDVPCLAFDLKSLRQSTDIESLVKSDSVIHQQFMSIFQHLFSWRWSWERQYSHSVKEVVVTSSELFTDESETPCYRTLIHFSNRMRAMEIIYYNATLIYLFRMARQLQWCLPIEPIHGAVPLDLAQPLPLSPLTLPSDMHSLEDASSEFYRSVESCLCVTAKEAGDWYQLMFALSLANTGLDDSSLEAMWMRKIRERIIATSGLDMWAAARRSCRASPVHKDST